MESLSKIYSGLCEIRRVDDPSCSCYLVADVGFVYTETSLSGLAGQREASSRAYARRLPSVLHPPFPSSLPPRTQCHRSIYITTRIHVPHLLRTQRAVSWSLGDSTPFHIFFLLFIPHGYFNPSHS